MACRTPTLQTWILGPLVQTDPDRGTYQVLLIWVFGMQQVDETTHQALLLSKVLWVGLISRLVRLVLNERGDQAQDGVHLGRAHSLQCDCVDSSGF